MKIGELEREKQNPNISKNLDSLRNDFFVFEDQLGLVDIEKILQKFKHKSISLTYSLDLLVVMRENLETRNLRNENSRYGTTILLFIKLLHIF